MDLSAIPQVSPSDPAPVDAAPIDTGVEPASGEATTPPEGADTIPPEGNDSTTPEGSDTLTADSYTIQLPEGFEVNEDALGEFKAILAKAGAKPEAAQGLFDLYVTQNQAWAQAIAERNEAWAQEVRADAELGGHKTADVTAAIGRLFDEYGSEEAREIFTQSGAGHNIHVTRFLNNMAKVLSEGHQLPQGGPARQPGNARNDANAWYPEMQPKQ